MSAAGQDKGPTTRPEETMRRRRRLSRAVTAILIVVAAGALGWWLTRPADTISYITRPADRGTVARSVSATGTVNPVLIVTVGSYVSGVISDVLCDFNDNVTKGQVCARIDDRTFQSDVTRAQADLDLSKAQLAKDEANLEYARQQYERNRQMAESSAVSQSTADLAKSTYAQAQAQIEVDHATIEQKQSALASAKINLDYTEIRSPVSGTVILRNVTAGQTVAASLQTPTLFLIAADLKKMQVDANVSESDIGAVKQGDPASFTVNAYPGRTFDGTVTQVRQSPQSVQNVITYDVIIGVENSDLALKPGMTASARIVVASRKDVLRVPSKALRYQPSTAAASTGPAAAGQARVYVLKDGAPSPVPVRTGLDDGSYVEILDGTLSAGAPVILGESSGAAPSSSAGASAPRGVPGFHP